ncbi:class I SAM-dependent methyltransferase [Rhodococcus sp. T2V]|uniref:HemK2/MTQ2 family protein methyltransferase n=1 Tax=Rhodococcus sp. T2V TaxID=3034164 RepID=UPI0023E1A6F2|nr:HemK2/MTQ2 family protein methyltransferase [Rhodococcus sp. T2V]MDF3312968.1 class I SAM-dependent methyltransferase [Rhodococcus sp. T2V]
MPGVYPPQEDTWLLASVLRSVSVGPRTRVLDLCTGTGALAVCAAEQGAGRVTAVDISRRALVSAWANVAVRRRSLVLRRGDLLTPVRDERFDLVVSNPPYVPAAEATLPGGGIARAWDAGRDGRALLDRICMQAPEVLADHGALLLVQSVLSDVEKTYIMLEEQGLRVEIAAQQTIAFGKVLMARRSMLENMRLIEPGQRSEEIVVLRATQ